VATHGRPLALYHDRHGIFQPNPPRAWSVEEQLAGRPQPTQFGRLLEELAIASIAACSPQAKGRVERLFNTLQDRLTVELRLAGTASLEAANRVLPTFLPKHNARFRVPATEPGSAYRPLDPGCRPEEVFCFKYQRTVAADNTVRLGEHRLQLLPSRQRASWARATVEIHERLDGSLAVYYQGTRLATQAAPLEAPALRARAGRSTAAGARHPAADNNASPPRAAAPPPEQAPTAPRKPAPDHSWRQRGLFPQGVSQSLNAEDKG